MPTTVPRLPPRELHPPDPQPGSDWPSSSRPARPWPTATPTAAPLPGRVLRRGVPRDPAHSQRDQLVREAPSERSGLRPRAGDGDTQDQMDLLRLHRPRPDVVIVRVSGTVNMPAARLLAELAGKQLNRAPHVVIDLGDVNVLGPQGLTVLLTLHQQAIAGRTALHIVGPEHDAVRSPLHGTALAQLLSLESTADAVIASLPQPGHVPRRLSPHRT